MLGDLSVNVHRFSCVLSIVGWRSHIHTQTKSLGSLAGSTVTKARGLKFHTMLVVYEHGFQEK